MSPSLSLLPYLRRGLFFYSLVGQWIGSNTAAFNKDAVRDPVVPAYHHEGAADAVAPAPISDLIQDFALIGVADIASHPSGKGAPVIGLIDAGIDFGGRRQIGKIGVNDIQRVTDPAQTLKAADRGFVQKGVRLAWPAAVALADAAHM